MKKINIVFCIFLCLFSYYYYEKVNLYIINKSPIMKSIINNKANYEISKVEPTIDNIYAIPGIDGKKINILKSFKKMKKAGKYDSSLFEYEIVKPQKSINNLVIKNGNSLKNNVSIVTNNNSYLLKNVKNITRLVDKNTFDKNASYEQINVNNDKKIDNLLNLYNKNKNISIYNNKIISNKINVELKKISESDIYNITVEPGNIYYIDDRASKKMIDYLLKKISYNGFSIVFLSDLISSER